jgi:DNA-directed RNA polymerase subunit RPC12/RpoP
MTDKIRDYNFKKNIIRCNKCNRKIFHLNSEHYCIKYEPCSMESQIIADEIDDELNRNKTGMYFNRNGQQYTLNLDALPQKLLDLPATDSRPQAESKSYVRYECNFCGQQINDFQKEKHQNTKKCKNMKARYYRE